jgi:hypothetical protein
VAVGETLIDPLVPTAPMPGWISQESAFLACHRRVTDCPCLILLGWAERCTKGRGGGATWTVTLAVAVPPAPIAVMVYEVVTVGETLMEPLAPTAPMPGSISQEVAFVELHVRIDDRPYRMLPGAAEIDTVGGGVGGVTVIVALALAVPPGPVAVMV